MLDAPPFPPLPAREDDRRPRRRGPLSRLLRAAGRDPRVVGFVPGLAYLLVTLVGRTIDVEEVRADLPRSVLLGRGHGGILALWHDQLFILTHYLGSRFRWKGLRCAPLVSPSRDGELLARFFGRFGAEPVRGSTTRGGAAGLLALLRAARSGVSPVITPDGPLGPRHRVQSGVILAAERSGLPILPLACALREAVRLPSWDRFQLPVPFTRARVAWGEPIRVPRYGTGAEAADRVAVREAARARLERALEDLTAEARLGAGPSNV
ncbi:MAG: DUF374 domain-containing protein [Planctomycetes bacterium]|nr:DUF374 domain-containing protein [Planctomycetota bacterium]